MQENGNNGVSQNLDLMKKLERIELDLKAIRERLGGDSEIPTIRPLPYNQVEEEIYRALLFSGESYASEIARATSRDERTVGKYLRVLESRGIVECIRVEGRKHYYRMVGAAS